ncbi:MAG: portal protein [Cetobacterium sp.]|uniref:portal protein n=1 Tax=Cetobacterium sp. TaxID=2071632 RepID=UPI003EE7036F
MEIEIKNLGEKADDLLQQINHAKEQTESSRDTNLARYQRSWKYYRALLPARAPNEYVGYVEPILYEAVSNIKPSLLNVFTENEEQAVVFRPQTTQVNKLIVDAVNKRINDIFLRENEGKRILGDMFTEGLVTGDTFIKFYVEEYPTEQSMELEEWTPAPMVEMLGEMWPQTDFTTLDTKEDIFNKEPTTFYKGKLKLLRVDTKPIVEHIPSGDLYVDDTVVNIADSRYVGHRRVMTVGQAIDLGFDKDAIDSAETYDYSSDELAMSTRDLVIDKQLISGNDKETVCIDDNERKIVIWEHYIYSSIPSKDGRTALYQVMSTDNDIISVKKVSRIPFCHGVPESVPGSFWGGSLYDRTHQLQDLISIGERARINASLNVANIRYLAIKGKYDRQSVLNNRPGGIIEQTEGGAIQPFQMPDPNINNMTVALSELTNKKDRLISTSVGSVINGGALNNAAASTVAMTLANEELKDKVIAKTYAWTLIKPLFELIYETIRELDMPIPVDDPTGQMPAIKGSALPPIPDFTIDVNTGNDDAIKANSLSQILTLVANTSSMPIPLIDAQKAYNIAADLCRLQGIDNADDYFLDPSKAPEPTEEEIAAQQEAQMIDKASKQMDIDLKTAQIQLAGIQTIKVEKEIEEMLKDGETNRQKEAELLKIKYEELALKRAEAELDYAKYEAQKVAMEADMALTAQLGQGVDITVPR